MTSSWEGRDEGDNGGVEWEWGWIYSNVLCRSVKIQDGIFENIPDTGKNRGNASCNSQVLSCVFLQK